LAQWRRIAALANDIGVRRAAKKLDIPDGAISAAQRGEWHRLA
jgi:hypothetical protein